MREYVPHRIDPFADRASGTLGSFRSRRRHAARFKCECKCSGGEMQSVIRAVAARTVEILCDDRREQCCLIMQSGVAPADEIHQQSGGSAVGTRPCTPVIPLPLHIPGIAVTPLCFIFVAKDHTMSVAHAVVRSPPDRQLPFGRSIPRHPHLQRDTRIERQSIGTDHNRIEASVVEIRRKLNLRGRRSGNENAEDRESKKSCIMVHAPM